MNILAHLYLSGSSDEIKFGNFIGDYVKGNHYKKFPELISQGILIHRDIDDFTDKHPIVLASKTLLYNSMHKFSGIIVDIIYDHFLARDWKKYSSINYSIFIENFFTILKNNHNYLPDEVKSWINRFINNNWFQYYHQVEGMRKVLKQMSTQTNFPSSSDDAINEFILHYFKFENHFNEFFPQLQQYIANKYKLKN